jgi:mRNA-degrading endonuclease toxin of MazEF toxin-antitoxin module
MPGEPEAKRRPALVVSIDARNRLANDVMVIPASTTLRPSVTHVQLREGQGGVPRDSVLKCEQLTTLPKECIADGPLSGPLSALVMSAVEKAVLRAIGVPIDD